MKRHIKCCKQYASGKCRFKSDCSYNHLDSIKSKEPIQLEEKVKQLEKVAHALTRKVLTLETEMERIKSNKSKTSDVVEGLDISKECDNQGKVKDKETEKRSNISDVNCFHS